ncbi:unnamed protein product [Ixodes pacificus]
MLDGSRNFHCAYALTSRITEIWWQSSLASMMPITTTMRINHVAPPSSGLPCYSYYFRFFADCWRKVWLSHNKYYYYSSDYSIYHM